MKQKDLAVILMVAGFSAIVSLSVTRLLFKPNTKLQTVEVVEPITAEFKLPDERYFNSQSYNPTQLIEIKGNNTNPF